MGCHHGKAASVAHIQPTTNGKINGTSKKRKEKEEEPTELASVDPRAPLSARQVFKLQKSWKAIKRNMQMAGIEMFLALFRTRSDLKNLFKGFSELDGENELRESNALEAHATLVMGVFDEAIQNIEKVDYVFQLLEKVGRSHQRFPGFTGDLFWNMEKPFMNSVRITLGDRYNDSIETVYHRTISFLLTNLERAFKNEKMDKV